MTRPSPLPPHRTDRRLVACLTTTSNDGPASHDKRNSDQVADEDLAATVANPPSPLDAVT